MPCIAIHLAVAKKYLEKHPDEKYNEFILGTIAPDITLDDVNKYINGVFTDKNSRHFGTNNKTDDIIEYMKNKVDFKKFFEINDINSSFLRAYFLHLVCDYYFFGEYITSDKLKGLSFMDAVKLGYSDYDLITAKLIKKYNLNIPMEVKDLISMKEEGDLQIIDEVMVDNFINEMSNIDLYDRKKLLTSNSKLY